MSDRYWVAAAAGDWDDTANWSETSGGAGGASVPASGDDVYFDANGPGVCTMPSGPTAATVTVESDAEWYSAAAFTLTAALHVMEGATLEINGVTSDYEVRLAQRASIDGALVTETQIVPFLHGFTVGENGSITCYNVVCMGVTDGITNLGIINAPDGWVVLMMCSGELNFGTVNSSLNVQYCNDPVTGSIEVSKNVHARVGSTGSNLSGFSVTLNGDGAQEIWAILPTIGDVSIDKSAGTATLAATLGCESLTLTSGNVDPAGFGFTTTGDLSIASGVTFADLAGSAWTVGGNFEATGVTLPATASWELSVTGTATATGVDVQYSDASGGTTVAAISSTDSGDNVNWVFTTPSAGSLVISASSLDSLVLSVGSIETLVINTQSIGALDVDAGSID